MSNLSRSKREARAFQLTLASGGGSVASAVVFILWVAGVASFGLFFLLLAFTAISVLALRRTLGK